MLGPYPRSASERLQDIRKDVADVGPFMFFKKKPQPVLDKLESYYHSENYPYSLSFETLNGGWYKYPLTPEARKKITIPETGTIDSAFVIPLNNNIRNCIAFVTISIFKSVFDATGKSVYQNETQELLRKFYQAFFDFYSDRRYNNLMSEIVEMGGIETEVVTDEEEKEVYKHIRIKEKKDMLDRMLKIVYSSYNKNWSFLAEEKDTDSVFEIHGFLSNNPEFKTLDYVIPIHEDILWFRGIAYTDMPDIFEEIKTIARSIKIDKEQDK